MNPPPPWYSAPSLKAPRMRRVASSCSKVRSMPRGFAAPQPKQELVGLGVSSMFGVSGSPLAFRYKRNRRSLASLPSFLRASGMTALRPEQKYKSEAKEPAGGQRYKTKTEVTR